MTTHLHSFTESFSTSFDRILPTTNPPATVYMFQADRDPHHGDMARTGDTWLNYATRPPRLFVYTSISSTAPPGWFPAAQLREVVKMAHSERLYRLALLRAARWWFIVKAPLGVLDGDMGSVYVSRIDTEATDLLQGFHGANIPWDQHWPDADAVGREVLNLAGGNVPVSKVGALDQAIAAAVEWVTDAVTNAFGVAN